MINAIFIGDLVGRYGRRVVRECLPRLRELYSPDIIILNGENSAGGFGITEKIYDEIINEWKVDAITTGNHWHDKKEVFQWREAANRLVVPANMYDVKDESWGLKILKSHTGVEFSIINVIGQVFMHKDNRSPFDALARLTPKIPASCKLRFVDIHAEATSEKQAVSSFLGDRVSMVYGTHSHVPTADERILFSKAGFVTDIGLTGGYDSIIGMDRKKAMTRFLTKKKVHMEPASGDLKLLAMLGSFNPETGACEKLERIRWDVPLT